MSIFIEYVDERKFEKWFDALPTDAAEAVLDELRKLEGGQNRLKPLGRGLFELRIFRRPGYRIYGTFDSDTFVIVGFGSKGTQKRDIRNARRHIDASHGRGRPPPFKPERRR